MESPLLQNLFISLTSPGSIPDVGLLTEDPEAYLQEEFARVGTIMAKHLHITTSLPLYIIGPGCLFPRLHLFAAACALCQSGNTKDLTRAPQEVKTVVEQLALYDRIRTLLHSAIQGMTSTGLPLDQWEQRIFSIDLRAIGAMVLQQLENSELREAFLQAKALSSVDQGLMDLMQLLLDEPALDGVHDKLLRAQLRLAKYTGLYPRSLRHEVLENCSLAPVAIGGFGDIYKASLQGQGVALKVMRRSLDGISQLSMAKIFAQEVILWSHVDHLNILPFYGVYVISEEKNQLRRVAMLSPWMDHGSVVEYIKKNPHADRAALVLDIVRGLDYLHSFKPAIVHGDLKGDNILVSPSGRACLADFGLGRLVQDKLWLTSAASTLFGAHLYLAPELLDDSNAEPGQVLKHSLSTDMYAFGCVCYELYAGHPRFFDIAAPMRRYQAILTNKPCSKPEIVNDSLWEKVLSCWDLDPVKRPSISHFYLPLNETGTPPSRGPSPREWDGQIVSRIRPKSSPLDGLVTALSSASAESAAMQLSSTPVPILASPLGEGFRRTGRSVRLQGWKTAGLTSTDVILLVLGAPLSGKTTFVKKYFSDPALPVGPVHHQLLPPSHDITAYLESGRDTPGLQHGLLLMIDTPGLFSWKSNDLAIVKEIVELIELNHTRRICIVYLHDISSSRMTIDVTMSLAILKSLCGKEGYQNVWLTTTHWGRDPKFLPSGYDEREAHLKSVHWKELLEGGAQYRRIHGTCDEQAVVNDIVHSVAVKSPSFEIRRELLERKGNLIGTDIWKLLKGCLGMLLEEEARSSGNGERRDFLRKKHREMTLISNCTIGKIIMYQ